MELTGKCKKDFFKWFQSKSQTHYRLKEWFEDLDNSMQYGVYVDFFDEKSNLGIIQNVTEKMFYWKVKILKDSKIKGYSDFEETRPEARTEAIKKANEIYNQK